MHLAHSLQVIQMAPQGTDAMLLTVAPPSSDPDVFHFSPGQYLTVAGGDPDTEQWRCYSLVSDPSDTSILSVLVRRVPSGIVSNWLCDHMQPGNSLKVLPPAGRFRLRAPGLPALLFAGGSGIAPIFSLARQALESGAPKVRLFYANRNQDTAMLMSELSQLKMQYGETLDLHNWYDSQDGLPSIEMLASYATGITFPYVYLCGPDPFMKAAESALLSAGISKDQILREVFDIEEDEGGSAADANADATAHLRVKLKGQIYEFDIHRRDTLLAAMIKEGLPVPHACKMGECASCMCRLDSGEIDLLSNSVLDDEDVEDGWLVACRSHAKSDSVSIKY